MTLSEDGITEKDESEPTGRLLEIACFIEEVWVLHGVIPTNEKIAERFSQRVHYPIDLEFIEKSRKDPKLKKYLRSRGIREEVGDFLTPEQLMVARMILNPADRRSIRQKLKSFPGGEISIAKYQSWLKQPVFKKFMNDAVKGEFENFDHEALTALMDNVRDGREKSLQMYLEMAGMYVPRQVHEINPTQLIGQLVEIVSRYVSPDQLQLIGEDIERLLPNNPVRQAIAIEVESSESSATG